MDEIRFGSYVLQPNRQLLLDREHVHLGRRALAILTVLAEADGEIVTKDELMEAVWHGITVEENALQAQVTALRKALGDNAQRLHTVRGIGYQLDLGEIAEDYASEAPKHDGARHPAETSSQNFNLLELRRPALIVASIGAALLIMVTIVFLAVQPFGGDSAVRQAPRKLAVLPFQVSGEEEWRGREGVLTAAITGNLARVPNIDLASETATDAIAGQGLTPAEIGKRLDVDHLIEGDVLVSEQHLVGQIRLIEASTGSTVWTDEVSADQQFAYEFEPRLLNRIAGTLIALDDVASGDIKVPADLDPRAYDAFLDGLSAASSGGGAFFDEQFLQQMQLAASIEPEFAAAHGGIAYALARATNNSYSIPPHIFEALQLSAIERALSIDPDDIMAHLARGHYALNSKGDVAAGMGIAERLLEQRPTEGKAHNLMAHALHYAGRYRRAIEHVDQAILADPFNYDLDATRRGLLIDSGNYNAVARSARTCRVQCWMAGLDWWESLSRDGGRVEYERDMKSLAAIYEDERAYPSGEQSPGESLLGHGRFLFEGVRNPFMEGAADDGSASGISHWVLVLFAYGEVDAGFAVAERDIERAPAHAILTFLKDDALTPSPEIRADPRYHALFYIPRFKAVAEYRREQGMMAGLPVFPVKPYEGN